MTDYSELVKALRCHGNGRICGECTYKHIGKCSPAVANDAADAIESLQKELDAVNHQLKMCSMCPFDDDEEEE